MSLAQGKVKSEGADKNLLLTLESSLCYSAVLLANSPTLCRTLLRTGKSSGMNYAVMGIDADNVEAGDK